MTNLYQFYKEQILHDNFIPFKVTGNSMMPFLRPGVTIQAKKSNGHLKVGDIVLINNECSKLPVLHRVIYISDDYVVTKGDNNPYADLPVKRSDIIKVEIDGLESTDNCANSIIAAKYSVNVWDLTSINGDFISKVKAATEINCYSKPGTFENSSINIAINAISPHIYSEINFLQKTSKSICFHAGVKISNFPCEGYVLDNQFDYVIRVGTLIASEVLTLEETILILCGQIL